MSEAVQRRWVYFVSFAHDGSQGFSRGIGFGGKEVVMDKPITSAAELIDIQTGLNGIVSNPVVLNFQLLRVEGEPEIAA